MNVYHEYISTKITYDMTKLIFKMSVTKMESILIMHAIVPREKRKLKQCIVKFIISYVKIAIFIVYFFFWDMNTAKQQVDGHITTGSIPEYTQIRRRAKDPHSNGTKMLTFIFWSMTIFRKIVSIP